MGNFKKIKRTKALKRALHTENERSYARDWIKPQIEKEKKNTVAHAQTGVTCGALTHSLFLSRSDTFHNYDPSIPMVVGGWLSVSVIQIDQP